MSYVLIPHKGMFLCPVCPSVDGKDSMILHLLIQHDWNEPDIKEWLVALDF